MLVYKMGTFPRSLKDLAASAESLAYVEDLSGRTGLLQALNPMTKIIVTILMITGSLFVWSLPHLVVLCLIPLILAFMSKIPPRKFVSRTVFIPVFAAVISIPILFLTYGNPIFKANLGAFTLSITWEGLQKFSVFTVRAWFCVASLILLTLSTGFDEILRLLSSMKVPTIVIQLFSLTYRYFFVLIYEVQRVLIAKEARTYVNRHTMNLEGLKHSGVVLANLFMRTYERSERVYMAMKSRGFEIDSASKSSMPTLGLRDLIFAVSAMVAFGLLAVFAVL